MKQHYDVDIDLFFPSEDFVLVAGHYKELQLPNGSLRVIEAAAMYISKFGFMNKYTCSVYAYSNFDSPFTQLPPFLSTHKVREYMTSVDF